MKCRSTTILVAAAGLALVIPTGAAAAPPDPIDRFQKAPSSGPIGTAVQPRSVLGNQPVELIVELTGDPVAVVQARAGRTLSSGERTQVRHALAEAQGRLAEQLTRKGVKVLTRMQSAVNAVRVRTTSAQVASIAALPGVKAVHAVPRHTVSNTVSVPFLGVPDVWSATGYTGAGVKVAIIDTGIDYTHADFGGPGTTSAYATAHAGESEEAAPTLFGPGATRVKGGYDFVGDAYDADDAQPVVRPDRNPLDCNGHGTHVAGTAAGGGVRPDGTPYTGPYDASTSELEFKVGPGVAPRADLYALRVFGCKGSTEYTTEAIDWAVRNQMDVINLSLGSPFGRADDVDSLAASNAVASGTVVVASAGNEGPNPYLVGTPGAGHGVVSVAAVDSTPTFPGAQLDFSGGGGTQAINANAATLPAGPYEIVVLADDPSTTGVDESLGCSPGAFTAAGVSGNAWAPLQLAVVHRGDCARVAKAIFGQQAGADAVLMVNNADGMPPFEGVITANPDDRTAFDVTIPFLGVPRGTPIPKDETVTLSSATVQNAGFRGYASFSSGGPRSGDSGLAPSVSAPGVSIGSAGVGTGSDVEVLSGTSMAAPHVAGVAALAAQAHPTWSAADLSAAIVSTADPEKVSGHRIVTGGTGLVDAAQAVRTQVVATGDAYVTEAGTRREPVLSFGFIEPSSSYTGTRTITLVNRGRKAVTYSVAVKPSSGNVSASASLSTRRVRVPARGTARVKLRLSLAAAKAGSSLNFQDEDDQWAFRQVSGSVVLSARGSVLRIPYLLVPRAQAKVAAALTSANPWLYGATPSAQEEAAVTLTNPGGAINAAAEVYTWGLSDGRDAEPVNGNRGFDLRAAGVQSLDTEDGKLVVFAVNNFTRASNAAANEFDVDLDTNGDGKTDIVVFSVDSGLVRTGSPDGYAEVFYTDVAAKKTFASGFLATAPTDSSTILLPVLAEDLGLTEADGAFTYRVSSSSLQGPWTDKMGGVASYNPFRRAIVDGGFVEVPRNGSLILGVSLDTAAQADQRPRGVMVVVFDNKAGQAEALLLGR